MLFVVIWHGLRGDLQKKKKHLEKSQKSKCITKTMNTCKTTAILPSILDYNVWNSSTDFPPSVTSDVKTERLTWPSLSTSLFSQSI